MKIRLLLADAHPALLAGVRHELSVLPTLDVLGTAHDVDALIDQLQRATFDVLVTDYKLPRGKLGDGLALISYVRRNYPALKIVVFTNLDNPGLERELGKLGVKSALSKTAHMTYLISAIHAAYADSDRFQARENASPPGLTTREFEVIRLYTSGMSINEIAGQLHRAKQTISSQKSSAMRKLGIARDADLFRYAYETDLAASNRPAWPGL
ncbi:response regulator [Achromobacter sp. NPDC058515]|uniref:response regulator n=1 Tax=Achromobacter sp. NPDC058515 TaxID=3346533 RepID=UPI00365DC56E